MITENGNQNTSNLKHKLSSNFDWLQYNLKLAYSRFGEGRERVAIAIDQSYVRETANKTAEGCPFGANTEVPTSQGLEILGIGMVNADTDECVMLRAIQTLSINQLSKKELNQPEWYLSYLWKYSNELKMMTDIVVADTAFSTRSFVDGLQKLGFQLVSRLKTNVALSYLYDGPATGLRGRPKKYDGKIDFNNLDKEKARMVPINPAEGKAFELCAWSIDLERIIKLVVHYPHKGRPRLYFSTDETMKGSDLYKIYQSRFLMEYGFRDINQLKTIPYSESRADEALIFPHNASLSALNILRLQTNQSESKHEELHPRDVSPRIRP